MKATPVEQDAGTVQQLLYRVGYVPGGNDGGTKLKPYTGLGGIPETYSPRDD